MEEGREKMPLVMSMGFLAAHPFAIAVDTEGALDNVDLGRQLLELFNLATSTKTTVGKIPAVLSSFQKQATDAIVSIRADENLFQGNNVVQIGEDLMINRNEPQGRQWKPCGIRSHGGDCGMGITVASERPVERDRQTNEMDSVYFFSKW